jgi:hypothetical protein
LLLLLLLSPEDDDEEQRAVRTDDESFLSTGRSCSTESSETDESRLAVR